MTLEEKGPILPPPVLPGQAQKASATIQRWAGIISATHWDLYRRDRPDGADFYIGSEELGHIHLDGSVHLVTGNALCGLLLDAGLAKRFPYGSGWVLFNIASEADAEHALWLFRLNYDRLHGATAAELRARIGQQSAGVLQR